MTTIINPHEAGDLLASVLGDGMTMLDIGPHLTCNEANTIATALVLLGKDEAAATVLAGHLPGDEEGDAHVEDMTENGLGDPTNSEDVERAAALFVTQIKRDLQEV